MRVSPYNDPAYKAARKRAKAMIEAGFGRCGICGGDVHGAFHLDHVIPIVDGGTNDVSNLRITHPRCNMRAGQRISSKRRKGRAKRRGYRWRW